MNEKTFRRLFPKVKLSVCPYEKQNFGNSIADISILGQFCTYLQFRGEKYLNTFIVTNANDCPNLLSHGATFRMGVLLPNYPEENVVKGENVPNFKFGASCKVLLLAIQWRVWLVLLCWYFSCLYLTFGECCESVPQDRTGSYVSISVKHITIILAACMN